jgi:hypothetical protein
VGERSSLSIRLKMSCAKDALMLVLDVGASMEAGHLDEAKNLIRRLLGQKFVSGGQHEVALVAFASETTSNELYEGEGSARQENAASQTPVLQMAMTTPALKY